MGNCGQDASALCPKYTDLKSVAMVLFKLDPSMQTAFTKHVCRKSWEWTSASQSADVGAMERMISVKPRNYERERESKNLESHFIPARERHALEIKWAPRNLLRRLPTQHQKMFFIIKTSC